MDVHGNISWRHSYPIDMTSILPPPEAVSIPDTILREAVQHKIDGPITTHTLLNLTKVWTICFGFTQPCQRSAEYRASMYLDGLSGKNPTSQLRQINTYPLTRVSI